MRKTAAIATALLLAGCSSGQPSVEDIEAFASAAASELAGDVETATDAPAGSDGRSGLPAVAEAIGCGLTYEDASDDSPLTREYGTCLLGAGSVQLYRFGTPQVIDTFWEVSAAFGATPDQCAARDLVIVCPADVADLPAIRAALGS